MKHAISVLPLLVATSAASCDSDPPEPQATDAAPNVDAASVADAAEPDAFWPAGHVPRLRSLSLGCKLISDSHIDDPTPNRTHQRANLRGTDLGIPVAHHDTLYLFFGDTAGHEGIWPLGPESLPDAVGYATVSSQAVAADPTQLCRELRFLVTDTATGSVDRDFAAAHMTPPPGRPIGEFVHNPAGPRGAAAFPNLPGDFEVPSGAFSHGDSIYLFYTIINHDPFEMRGSYLARWNTPSTTGLPNYDILYHVDQRFDDNGPLRGDFINIAALVQPPYLYMYGTGQYRASPVHLARKRLDALEMPGGYERYDAATDTWVAPSAAAEPIVAAPHIGELSVRYFPKIGRYVMLDQEVSAGNRIAARFSEAPTGPWSEPVTVATMSDPDFAARYCCIGNDCSGPRLFECQHAGFYGTYLLPQAETRPDGTASISFLMSTWIPYNVALMTVTFE